MVFDLDREDSNRCKVACSNILLIIFGVSFGSSMIHQGRHFNENASPIIVNIVDIPTDWDTLPYVDLQVVPQDEICPDGTEYVFERLWFGMTYGCSDFTHKKEDKNGIIVNKGCDTGDDKRGQRRLQTCSCKGISSLLHLE